MAGRFGVKEKCGLFSHNVCDGDRVPMVKRLHALFRYGGSFEKNVANLMTLDGELASNIRYSTGKQCHREPNWPTVTRL